MKNCMLAFALVVAILLLASPAAAQAPTLTTITDTVYKADGSLASGIIIISWQPFMSSGGRPILGGSKTVQLAAGALSVALVPNAGALPAGSSYTVKYYQSSVAFAQETWVVSSSSAPLRLSQVRVLGASTVSGIAGTLPIYNGGTGLTAVGLPRECLKVTDGGAGLEYGSCDEPAGLGASKSGLRLPRCNAVRRFRCEVRQPFE